MNPGVTYLDWKRSSGWLESWEGPLFATNVSTICAVAIFRVIFDSEDGFRTGDLILNLHFYKDRKLHLRKFDVWLRQTKESKSDAFVFLFFSETSLDLARNFAVFPCLIIETSEPWLAVMASSRLQGLLIFHDSFRLS